MTRDSEKRHYYIVELVDVEGEWDSHVERHEAEDTSEVAEVMQQLEDEGKLQWPNEVHVCRMTNLSAPLTDEEEDELQEWIAGFAESVEASDNEPDSCSKCNEFNPRCDHCHAENEWETMFDTDAVEDDVPESAKELDREEELECSECGGTGTVTPNDGYMFTGECPTCNGSGSCTLDEELDALDAEIEELEEEIESQDVEGPPTLEEGATVLDREFSSEYRSVEMTVTEVLDETVDEYEDYISPGPDSDRVVLASYDATDNEETFAFPESRVEVVE